MSNSKKTRCIYCHKKTDDLRTVEITQGKQVESVEICSDECEENTRKFTSYVEEHARHFLIGIFVFPFIGVGIAFATATFDNGAIGTAIAFGGLGAAMIKFPFATPQTVKLIGLKRSISVIKWSGWGIVISGIIAAGALFFT